MAALYTYNIQKSAKGPDGLLSELSDSRLSETGVTEAMSDVHTDQSKRNASTGDAI